MLAALIDGVVNRLVAAEFASRLHPPSDGSADVGGIPLVSAETVMPRFEPEAREEVPPLHVEIGDPADHLVLIAADEAAVPSSRFMLRLIVCLTSAPCASR